MPVATEQELRRKVPPAAADYCAHLLRQHPFKLIIRKPRKRTQGLFVARGGKHYVFVNTDLNQYAFLVTYLHEVAHLLVHTRHGGNVKPHGPEWKAQFTQLLQPMMTEEVFEAQVLQAVRNYAADPAASSCTDPGLVKALARHDRHKAHLFQLGELSPGTRFRFQEKDYKLIEHRRTRALIADARGGQFVIGKTAMVMVLSQPTLFEMPAITVTSLKLGSKFKLNGRQFEKVEQKTTRALCREVSTGKMYWVNGSLEVGGK